MDSNPSQGSPGNPRFSRYAPRCCWPGCGTDLYGPEPPLCSQHLYEAYKFGRAHIEAIREAAYKDTPFADEPLPQPRKREPRPVKPPYVPATRRMDQQGQVYFVRFSDRIKIGFSTNVEVRLRTVPHDEIMAMIPGTMRDEKRCHAAFAHLRENGEWFRMEQDLVDFIADLPT